MTEKLIIKKYTKNYEIEFKKLEHVFLSVFSNLNISIEHVGSTSIMSCYAKPIIDIDIVMNNIDEFQQIKDILISLGYKYNGDQGIENREVFVRKNKYIPLYQNNIYDYDHHLYVCAYDSLPLKNHILFRDYLKNHPIEIKKYSKLKLELLNSGISREVYTNLKTSFILEILKKAGLNKNQLKEIRKENL